MSLSHEIVQDDGQLVRYLLGLLPEQEAERFEEASIVDDQVALRLDSVEDDLVDAYVSGMLDPDVLERFESFYLASPRRREKVKFAERFLSAVDRAPVDAVRRPRASRPKTFWLLAAAALLVLGCGVLLFEDARLRQGLNDAERRGAALNDRAQALEKELDAERSASTDARQELDRVRAARPAMTTALVLLPQTRGVGPVPTIAVPPDTDLVMFDLRLDANDFTRYQVALRDLATSGIVWRSEPVTPGALRRPPTVSVAVPARVLKPQRYALELSGLSPAGSSGIVSAYGFQMESR